MVAILMSPMRIFMMPVGSIPIRSRLKSPIQLLLIGSLFYLIAVSYGNETAVLAPVRCQSALRW